MRSPMLKGRVKPNRRLHAAKRKDEGSGPKRSLRFPRGALPMLKVLGLLVVAAAVALGVMALRGHVLRSDYFAVKRIVVKGAVRLGESEVAQAAGIRPGTNIFSIQVSEAARALVRHPWVAEARVERRLPAEMDIDIRERKAWALISLGDLFLVDEDGEIFKKWEDGDPFLSPIITGVTKEWYVGSKDDVRVRLREALGVYREYERVGVVADHPLSEVNLAKDGSITLVTLDPAVSIHLGRSPFEGKIQKLQVVLDQLRRESLQAEAIFLDQEVRRDRVTVRLPTNPAPNPS